MECGSEDWHSKDDHRHKGCHQAGYLPALAVAEISFRRLGESGTMRNVVHHCAYCNYSSSLKTDVTRHERCHTGERPYPCEVCMASFSRKHVLMVHMRRHTGERPFRCNLCRTSFVHRATWVKHQRLHSRPQVRGAACDSVITLTH
ncbi:zinc finger protein 248-like [Ornithodoros turicata]|uniref:zinc finger protein 248-like n=1 Tax=Ornithodoros turicata TaxID=34597 RepID=UPI00313876C9